MTYNITDLSYEINAIPDEEVREWTRTAIENCDPRFWETPASMSGKYHPGDESALGGVVIHTKRVYFVAQFLIDAEKDWMTELEQSHILSACLLHDICRYEGRIHAEAAYPYYLNKLGKDFVNKQPEIMRAILRHMGRYGKERPESMVERLVGIADNIASKAHLILPAGYKK